MLAISPSFQKSLGITSTETEDISPNTNFIFEREEISFHCILYNIDSLEGKYSRRQLLSLNFQI